MHNGNSLKTALLLGLLSAILIIGGSAIAGRQGIYIGLAIAVATNFFSYYFSDKLALAMSGAEPLTEENFPEVYSRIAPLVENLARRMDIPMPKLYITPEESPNAFATGRNPSHASIAFTQGILQLMPDSELEGVVAHELGHVLHRDILISSVAATIAAAITAIARMAMFFGGRRDDDDEGGNPHRGPGDADPGSNRRHADPDGNFKKPGIRCGCGFGEICGLALSADRSPAKAGNLVAKAADGCQPGNPASLHHETVRRRRPLQALLDPPQHRRPHREIAADEVKRV